MVKSIKGKVRYIVENISTFKNWYAIFFKRFFRIKYVSLRLRNGLVLTGGERSLIPDLVGEIFTREVYNPKHLRICDGDVVMDIGANIGIYGLYALLNGASKIYAVEPLEASAQMIKKNFSINGFPSPHVLCLAVTDTVGEDKLLLSDSDSHGFISQKTNLREGSYKRVRTATLPEIFTGNKIQHIDFLKVDCEGCEGAIIQSMKKKDWGKINKVAIEYHDEMSILSHGQILLKLRKNGFTTSIKKSGDSLGYVYGWK